jgi:Fe-S-cluster-containing hydrogenase component 2
MKIQADNARCSGCKLCQLSCALANHNQNNPKMTAIKVWSEHFTTGTYRVAVCNQCGECALVCPTGAIKLEDGVYSINPETCINCRVCVQVCPSEVMFVHRGLSTPLKCTCCEACVRICPTHTLSLAE